MACQVWGTLGVVLVFMFCLMCVAFTAGYADGLRRRGR